MSPVPSSGITSTQPEMEVKACPDRTCSSLLAYHRHLQVITEGQWKVIVPNVLQPIVDTPVALLEAQLQDLEITRSTIAGI